MSHTLRLYLSDVYVDMQVEDEDTLWSAVASKCSAGENDKIFVQFGKRGGSIELNKILKGRHIPGLKKAPAQETNPHFTLYMYDVIRADGVLSKLQAFLRVCAAQVSTREITFIGLGCANASDKGAESVKRQQCPQWLLNYAMATASDLNILLVDPEFQDEDAHQEIYDFDPVWRKENLEEQGIRRYKYAAATSNRQCDIWLTVFATSIPEYSMMGYFDKSKTVAGVHIPTVFAIAGSAAAPDAFVLCGNFLSRTQWFVHGNQARMAQIPGIDI